MANNQQPNHSITNGGSGVHDGVFMCYACDNRPFPSHDDLLRHLLRHHEQQPAAAAQPPVIPPPPPANDNEMSGDDESSDDGLVIILDPPPPLGAPVAVPPLGEPQNGAVVGGQVVNGPPQVQQPFENGAGIHGTNGHVANGAQF